jgi:hypothetical protein
VRVNWGEKKYNIRVIIEYINEKFRIIALLKGSNLQEEVSLLHQTFAIDLISCRQMLSDAIFFFITEYSVSFFASFMMTAYAFYNPFDNPEYISLSYRQYYYLFR